jgi:hypothetical protein
MAKIIKKKSGWTRHIAPSFLAAAPCKPQKTIENVERITELYTMGNYGELNLGLLLDRLPPGSHLHDVIVSSNASRGYDDEPDVSVSFFIREMKTIVNPYYEKHVKDYEKYYAAWLIEKDNHKIVLKEWKAWVEQEDEINRLDKIAKAKKLLENNGMKVI